MITLRPGQTEVAEYQNGMLAVPAVPGAGKTTVLSHLAANLIARELQPGQKILIVTVMNSAVANFKSKMRLLLEERGLPARGYEVKTLHSLGLLIIKERPDKVMVNSAFDLITGEERERMLNGLTERWIASNRERWLKYLNVPSDNKWYEKGLERGIAGIKQMVNSAITDIKLRGFDQSEWINIKNKVRDFEQDSFLRWVIEIMEDYQRILYHQARLDFDDLIVLSYRLLVEDEDLRERMQRRWAYIFEDEAQDSTPLQEKIIKLLSSKSGNLLRVGDCNQGIMGFSGTDSSLFARFCEEVRKQPINVASRSTREIIDFANHYLKWVRSSFPLLECRNALLEQMIFPAGEDDPFPNPVNPDYGISVCEIDGNLSDELKHAARQAAKEVEEAPEKTIAILARENRYLQEVGEYLTKLGVEWEDISLGPPVNQHSLDDIKVILSYLAEPHLKNRLQDVLECLLADLDESDMELIHELVDQNHPEAIIYPIGSSLELSLIPDELITSQAWVRLTRALEDIRRWLDYSCLRADELVLLLAGELSLDTEQMELVNTFAGQLTRYLRDNPGSNLLTLMQETQTMDRTMNYVIKNMKDRQGYRPRPGVVSLATMHRAKGLEWDVVYVVGLTSDQFPESLEQRSPGEVWSVRKQYRNPAALAKAQLDFFARGLKISSARVADNAKYAEISESLRLIYVSVTRAKEKLVLSSHTRAFDKTLKPSSIFNEMKRFVREKSAQQH